MTNGEKKRLSAVLRATEYLFLEIESVSWIERKYTKNLAVYFFLLKRVLSLETASAARLLARIVRRAVSRAPSTFGGSAASMRRQVLALMMTPQRDSFSSFAIGSVIRPRVVTLRVNEFLVELVSHSSFPSKR